MTDFANHNTLLDRIYAVGEQLRAVLEARDVEAFAELVTQRGALVERLQGLDQPAQGPSAWKEQAALLNRQYTDVMAVATQQEQHLAEARGALTQVRRAKARYDRREPPRFLNRNLSG